MYIICFNGPPYSGKDTLASLFAAHVEKQRPVPPPIKEESLSLPLRSIAYAMVGLHYPSRDVSYDAFKTAMFELNGKLYSGRDLMIHVSERFLKQVYGQEIMADLLLHRNREFFRFHSGILLIRDCGFQIEIDSLIDRVGRENLMVVRIERPTCSFAGDSREWVFHPDPRMNMLIDNDRDLHHLATEAGRLYGRLVNQKGWVF